MEKIKDFLIKILFTAKFSLFSLIVGTALYFFVWYPLFFRPFESLFGENLTNEHRFLVGILSLIIFYILISVIAKLMKKLIDKIDKLERPK